MNNIKRRILQCGCLTVSMWALVPSLEAQQPQLTAKDVGQIVNEVLRVVAPPDRALGRVSIDKRRIVLDTKRTLSAFGHPSDSTDPSSLGIERSLTSGTESLLADCDFSGKKTCDRLGWRAYIWIQPLSVSNSEVVVRALVSWPDRNRVQFVENVAPTGRAVLEGFATEIHLARASSGEWKFVKEGATITGD